MVSHLSLGALTIHARSRSDNAAAHLGALHKEHVRARQALESLTRARDSYRTQFEDQVRQGLPAARWRNYQDYLTTLQAGIEQQQAAEVATGRQLDEAGVAWRESKRQLGAFETLAERTRLEALVTRARKEQLGRDALVFLHQASQLHHHVERVLDNLTERPVL